MFPAAHEGSPESHTSTQNKCHEQKKKKPRDSVVKQRAAIPVGPNDLDPGSDAPGTMRSQRERERVGDDRFYTLEQPPGALRTPLPYTHRFMSMLLHMHACVSASVHVCVCVFDGSLCLLMCINQLLLQDTCGKGHDWLIHSIYPFYCQLGSYIHKAMIGYPYH